MEPDSAADPLAQLHPAARAASPRVRIGIGAAIVLLVLALIVAVVVSAFSQQSGSAVVTPGSATTSLSPNSSAEGAGDETDTGSAPSATGQGARDGAGDGAGDGDHGAFLFVHVLGAVRRPGLFQLQEGARVVDAIASAGGLSEVGDPAGVNLARPVSDGEQLYVPARGEAQPQAPPDGGAAGGAPGGAGNPAAGGTAAGLVNLNTATVADLDSLPRIGPAMAQRIIDFRTANGRFSSIDELQNVAGIGQKTFDGLKDLVTV